MDTGWHFPLMIMAALIVFLLIIRLTISRSSYISNVREIIFLSVTVIIFGMLFGKYGAALGFPWYIYYLLPLLLTLVLPPIVLEMSRRQTFIYLLLALLATPLIHVFFAFFFAWQDFLPFWSIPSLSSLIGY